MASRHILAHLGRSQPPAKGAPKPVKGKGTGAKPRKAIK